jgi:hypothetical protein
MVHPNPFIDDEAEEASDYVDSSDENSYNEDEIDFFLHRMENHSDQPLQDDNISSTQETIQTS